MNRDEKVLGFAIILLCIGFVIALLTLAHQRDEALWQWACNEDPDTYEELCGKLPETTTTFRTTTFDS